MDDKCPTCGHDVDGCHDPANYCLHDDCIDLDRECDIRYGPEGLLLATSATTEEPK